MLLKKVPTGIEPVPIWLIRPATLPLSYGTKVGYQETLVARLFVKLLLKPSREQRSA